MFAFVVAYCAFLGVWPHTIDDYYQHQYGGKVRVALESKYVQVGSFMGLNWWGRPDANIPSSFLNLEATRVVERTYGAYLRIGPDRVGAGVMVYRRGVEHTDRPRVWGDKVVEETYAYSIGYYDGLRPVVWVTPVLLGGKALNLRAMFPFATQWNSGTLPWHDWEVQARWDFIGVDLALGGRRDGVVADTHLRLPLSNAFALGVDAGWIELPGWGRGRPRIAASVTLGGSNRSPMKEKNTCVVCSLW